MWYLSKRCLQMLVILVILSAALFGLLSSMPGNPIDLLITSNPNVKPEDVIRLKRLRGLDKPWYVQYVRWIFGYPEPARPPVILPIDRVKKIGALGIDLGDYLVDPNFTPNAAQLHAWISEIWPEWSSAKQASEIKQAIAASDLPLVLLTIAMVSADMQNQLVYKIDRESSKKLTVQGLFGSRADGFKLIPGNTQDHHLWFLVTNSYGQEKIGRVTFEGDLLGPVDLLTGINSQIVENDDKPFVVDLKKYLVDSDMENRLSFSLVDHSLGSLTKDGIYSHQFRDGGQNAVLARVASDDGRSQFFAFDVEHGVIGHHEKFNRGFLYFFVGDKNALGFSQTYKRPVYDLLFGTPPVCGDGKVDAGETCDNGNRASGQLCDANCFNRDDSFLEKLDAKVSGYIVSSGRIGNTIQLMLPAILLSLLIAIPLGIFSACRQYSLLDYIINFFAFVGISLPVFWFGIMMIYLFAENYQIFPAGGVQTPGIYGDGTWAIIVDRVKYAILPTIVLSIFYVGRWLRYMRASMLEVLPKDYIRTARAKGLSERAVILKHGFRNALIPVVTVLALSIPSLFGGAVLTETVFSWPGVGRLQYEAVMNSDYYVAIIVFLVAAVLVMVGNLLADAVYLLVDPRIRKQ